MKFIIDADCPRSIGTNLKAKGHQVKDIRDIKPFAPDKEIYELIKKDSFILITRDTDFGNILRYPATSNCGIILLRVYLLGINEIMALIYDLISQISEKDLLGSLTVVQKGRYRIRKI
jgi:predicted nuclease of predicted toxin-antitoxin system